ncbi:hypothetical protein BsWGS_26410 [Bradybaena similaris]
MELTVSRTSLSVAVLILVVCGAEAMNYLAFPRMGRSGYLAFPRMGRSQGQSETAESVANCCGLGLKSEFVVGQNGKEELDVVCAAKAGCCEGLREVVDQSSTGSSYSFCVPDSLFHQDTKSSTAEVIRKFKVLMRM